MSIPASGNSRPKRPFSKPGRVDLVPQEFDNLIEDQGVYLRVTPTLVCPNQTEREGTNHVLDCPLCDGSGIIDATSMQYETWAVMQGIKVDQRIEVQGVFDLKDARMTLPQNRRVYYWYKIEVLDFASIFNEMVKRSGSDGKDRLRYEVAAQSTDTPYICVDSDGNYYEKDADFTVTGREIQWLSEFSRPPEGTLFSISYPMLPTFRIIELLNENRYYYTSSKQTAKTPVQLPQQVLVRWDYLAKRSGIQETADE